MHVLFPRVTLLALAMASHGLLTAQYKGGNDDGFWASFFFRQNTTDAVVFKGSGNDGFGAGIFSRQTITDAAAFRGGNGDGFTISIYNRQSITDDAAFKGGTDDGFSVAVFVKQNSADENAFKGGSDDGFSMAVFNKQNTTDVTAFKGGGNDGFSFSVYLKNSALPVSLLHFTGKWQETTALINWQTVSENNSSAFIIERSFTGNNFITAGTVPAAGNSNTSKTYYYSDTAVALRNPSQKRFFYRLKTVDRDGKFSYSAVIVLVKDGNTSFNITVYPNPANAFINIRVEGLQNNHPLSVTIQDLQGRLMIQKEGLGNNEKLNTYQLIPGQYFISVYHNNQLIKTIPVIIQH